MKKLLIAAALAATAAPAAANAQDRAVTLQGCVTPGVEKGNYLLTRLSEKPGADGATMPDVAHGRRVIYWLDNDNDVRRHMNRRVEITGLLTGLEKSEAELKAGRHKDGGLLVEFEGPGKDVIAPASVLGAAAAGRTEPEKDDIPTYLARMRVQKVVVVSGECK